MFVVFFLCCFVCLHCFLQNIADFRDGIHLPGKASTATTGLLGRKNGEVKENQARGGNDDLVLLCWRLFFHFGP